MPIKYLIARQIFDAVGGPTVEVDLVTELGLFRVGVPSTDAKKAAEAVQLRDNVPTEYHGMGVSMAVKNINTIIAPELIKQNYEVTLQKEIDHFMLELDGTDTRARLGANAILAVSMVVAKAGAAKKGIPLYRHISDMAGVTSLILPVPHIAILNGGILAGNGLPFQEYGIMPTGANTFAEAMRIGTEIYTFAKNAIREKYGVDRTYVSDNGSFSVPLQNHRDALLFLANAIQQCRYVGKAELFMNAAASDLLKDGGYDLDFKNPNSNPQEYYSAEKLMEVYTDNIKEFGVVSVEDPFDQDDWGPWVLFNTRTNIQILGNDLTQTNIKRIGMAIDKNAGNAVALRINQAGTVTEVIEAFKVLKAGNMACCVIDRWGDTEDLFLADLVIGISAGQLKCGAPSRSERIAKYNQILRIEEELGALAKYAGKAFRGVTV